MLEGLDTQPPPNVAPAGKGAIDLDALYGLGTPAPGVGVGLTGFGQPLQQQPLGSAAPPPLSNNFGLGNLMGEPRLRPPLGHLPLCSASAQGQPVCGDPAGTLSRQ